MVRPIKIHGGEISFSAVFPAAVGLFVLVTLLVALCAKHARQHAAEKSSCSSDESEPNTPKSPLQSSKKLIKSISDKALLPLVLAKKMRREYSGDKEEIGLWQKAIMMGEKCQPPEFSGVIYYDYFGNRVPEMPKSPARASPLRSFTFPAPEKMDKTVF